MSDWYAQMRKLIEQGELVAANMEQQRKSPDWVRARQMNPVIDLLIGETDRLLARLAPMQKRLLSIMQKADRKIVSRDEDIFFGLDAARLQHALACVSGATHGEVERTLADKEIAGRHDDLVSQEQVAHELVAESNRLKAEVDRLRAEIERLEAAKAKREG